MRLIRSPLLLFSHAYCFVLSELLSPSPCATSPSSGTSAPPSFPLAKMVAPKSKWERWSKPPTRTYVAGGGGSAGHRHCGSMPVAVTRRVRCLHRIPRAWVRLPHVGVLPAFFGLVLAEGASTASTSGWSGDVEYLDLGFPSNVYWRKTGFYM